MSRRTAVPPSTVTRSDRGSRERPAAQRPCFAARPSTIARSGRGSRGRRPAALGTSAALLAALLGSLALAVPAHAADPIGEVAWVKNRVLGTPPGGSAVQLAVADPLVLDQRVETAAASGVTLTLGDDASMTLPERSRVTLDRLTVDQQTGATSSVLSVLVGQIRLALSRAFRGEVEVDTPTATIGIKGTLLVVQVDPRGDTVVWVLEGEVEVRSKSGGAPLQLSAGQLTVVAAGRPPTPPTPFDPATGAAAPQALSPDSGLPEVDDPVRPCLAEGPPDRGQEGGPPRPCPPSGQAVPQ